MLVLKLQGQLMDAQKKTDDKDGDGIYLCSASSIIN
jgi:hypothetical protein